MTMTLEGIDLHTFVQSLQDVETASGSLLQKITRCNLSQVSEKPLPTSILGLGSDQDLIYGDIFYGQHGALLEEKTMFIMHAITNF